MIFPRPTEADHLMVLSAEKTLGIELDEWQKAMLAALLMGHRLRAGMCCAIPPEVPWLRCSLAPDHEEKLHNTGSYSWFS